MSYRILKVMVLLMGIMLSGCADQTGKPQAHGLRLAYPNKIQYAPFIIGTGAEGRFAAAGIQVRPVIVTGGIDAAEALIAGETDIAAMGDVPAIILLFRDMRFQVICSYMESPAMHRMVAAPNRGIAAIRDLQGKRVAVHHGSSTHGALLAHLAEHGIDPASITFVPLTPDNFPEAMLRGEVDAIAGSEPWPQNVLDRVPGAAEIGALTVTGNSFPHLLVANRRYLEEHREEVDRLLKEVGDIEADISSRPDRAAEAVARVTGRTPGAEAQAMTALGFRLDFSPDVADGLKKTAAFLKAQGKIAGIPQEEALRPVSGLGR